MTFSEFLRTNSGAFVKPTANNNGLNIRNAEGQLVGTILMTDVPTEESEILAWVKSRLNHTVSSNNQNAIIRLNAPVEKGVSLASLWEETA